MLNKLFKVLKGLKFNIDKSYFKSIYQSHPEYPGLLAISDALTAVGVSHVVLKQNLDQISIKDRQYNTLAFIPVQGGKFDYIDSVLKNQELLNKWEGVTFEFSKKEKIEFKDLLHEDYKDKTLVENFSFLVLLVILSTALVYTILDLKSLYERLYFISSIFGLVVASAILYKEIGFKNETLDSFCTGGDNTDCENVLKSKYSYAIKSIKWSDLIFSYFLTQIIWIIYSQFHSHAVPNEIGLFSLFSTASLLFVFLSIYAQNFILQTWCRLCLLISATIVMQSSIYIYLQRSDVRVHFDLSYTLILIILFAFILFAEVIIKSLLKENVSNKLSIYNIKRVILRFDVFDRIVARQEFSKESLDDTGFLLGNTNATIKLTVASNLYCNHCKTHFFQLLNLLEKHGDKFCIEFRFILNSIDVNSDPNTNEYIYQFLLENTNEFNKQEVLLSTLSDWYKDMDLNTFKKKYKVKEVSCSDSKRLVLNQFEWFNQYQITNTPTTFLNGYKLPAVFDIFALEIVLPDLNHFYLKENDVNTGNVAIP